MSRYATANREQMNIALAAGSTAARNTLRPRVRGDHAANAILAALQIVRADACGNAPRATAS